MVKLLKPVMCAVAVVMLLRTCAYHPSVPLLTISGFAFEERNGVLEGSIDFNNTIRLHGIRIGYVKGSPVMTIAQRPANTVMFLQGEIQQELVQHLVSKRDDSIVTDKFDFDIAGFYSHNNDIHRRTKANIIFQKNLSVKCDIINKNNQFTLVWPQVYSEYDRMRRVEIIDDEFRERLEKEIFHQLSAFLSEETIDRG